MKILWVTNLSFPEVSFELGLNKSNSGGWMHSLANNLQKRKGHELFIVSVENINDTFRKKIKGINYAVLPTTLALYQYDKYLEEHWKKLIDDVQPDIIHIHGTEYAHGLSLINSCPNENYVTSIQGLISVYSDYYFGDLSFWSIFKNITLRDIIKGDTLFQAKNKFVKRGVYEIKYLKKINHIIGRTTWDKAHALKNNRNANYHYGGEQLRSMFYESKKWVPHNRGHKIIFLSQATYPIKGLHKVIEAVSFLKNEYPNLLVKVAGENITNKRTKYGIPYWGGYGKLTYSLLHKHDLVDKFQFLGNQDERKMVANYLNCDVFVCPSSIENSPNSLAEAQILGVPCIASQVGGVSDMATHNKDALLYRFEETAVLAFHLKTLFSDDTLVKNISKAAIVKAQDRHDRDKITNQLIKTYAKIMSSNNS